MSRELTKSARERYIRVVAIVLKITEGIGQSCITRGLQRQLPSYCSSKRERTEFTTSRAGSSSINILHRGWREKEQYCSNPKIEAPRASNGNGDKRNKMSKILTKLTAGGSSATVATDRQNAP